MTPRWLIALALALAALGGSRGTILAAAPLSGWQHTGRLTLVTTPDGANLAAGTAVEGFPVLVRLHRDQGVAERLGQLVGLVGSRLLRQFVCKPFNIFMAQIALWRRAGFRYNFSGHCVLHLLPTWP